LSVNISKLKISLIGLKLIIDTGKLLKGIKEAYEVISGKVSDATQKKEIAKSTAKSIVRSFDFGLDGLAIGVHTPTFSIAGLFLKQKITYNGKLYDQYVGGLIIKLPKIEITGVGAYGEIDGFTSLFIYAIAGFPGIGPPFFMLEKIALGFGYNRRVIIPPIQDMPNFPLVRLAMSDQMPAGNPVDALSAIVPAIVESFPPSKSEFFFALGIRFSSFKILNGFALFIVSWGKKLRFDVLGFLSMKHPLPYPVVVINITLRATVIPDDGIVQVEGRITEGSYLLTKQARLQGGFAFYAWFKDYKGVSAGDFVVSLGGYHPRFRKPAHYPSLPRFGLNWRVSNNLTIRAESYIALTPSFFMMGGRLSATFQAGSLKAWLEIYANFLIQWKPFAYEADMGIRIGAEWRTFIKTFRFSLEAHARIWGPEFGGEATIKIKFIKKTIKLGKRKRLGQNRIGWSDFKKSLLPKDEIASLRLVSGKIGDKEDNKGTVMIDPDTFLLEAESRVPVSKLVSPVKTENHSPFGVYPVRNARKATSTFTLSVSFIPFGKKQSDEYKEFEVTTIKNKLPAALWSTKQRLGLNESETLIEAVTGVQVVPVKMEPLSPVELKKLPKFSDYPHEEAWSWKPSKYKLSKNTDGYELKTTYGILRDEFKEEETDFSGYALRKAPDKVKSF